MLNIKFSDRELTTFEAHLMRQSTDRADPASEVDFIVKRAELLDDADRDALVRVLINYPFSQVRRLFNTAVEAAMPATMEALGRVAAEFSGRQGARTDTTADDDIDRMFSDELIG